MKNATTPWTFDYFKNDNKPYHLTSTDDLESNSNTTNEHQNQKKCCTFGRVVTIAATATVATAVGVAIGYAVNHFAPIAFVDDFLNTIKDQDNKQLIDRQIFASDPGNYSDTTTNSTDYLDSVYSVISNSTKIVYDMVTGNNNNTRN